MSDNGKTIRGSGKEIVKIARSKEVLRYLAINGVSWRFIIEKAPWWGGAFWERLIQSIRCCMKKSLGRTTSSYDELNTLLVEIESIVNSRPLTYVEDDQDGVSYTLSPSYLINGQRVTNTANDGHFEVISTDESLTRRARHHRHLLRQFTDQWRKIYLLNLGERHAQVTKNRKEADIVIRDVVILKNDTSNRMVWKLAKVEELFPRKDGDIRAAIIKVSSADRIPRLLKRSGKHLFPLRVNSNNDINQIEEYGAKPTSGSPVHDTPNTSANTTPRRNAAMRSTEEIFALFISLAFTVDAISSIIKAQFLMLERERHWLVMHLLWPYLSCLLLLHFLCEILIITSLNQAAHFHLLLLHFTSSLGVQCLQDLG